ncbi:hypothetical protein D3C81_311740 [compost metagenome]
MLCGILASRLQVTSTVERFDQYRLIAGGKCTKPEAQGVVCDAINFWRNHVSKRDRISLTFSYDGESEGVTELSGASCTIISKIFDSADEDDECQLSVELIVHKVVKDQRLSLYAPDLLGEYFAKTPILQILESLGVRLNGELTFECMDSISAAFSSSISFVCASGDLEVVRPSRMLNRSAVFGIFQDNSFSRSLPEFLVPQDFDFVSGTGVPNIDGFFRRARTLISAIYLSNSAEVNASGDLEYRISGYKNIAGAVPLVGLEGASDILFKIVDWAYGDGGSSDKIGLARNVMSLHVDQMQDVASYPQIFHAINSNYQIYLRDNVESYLDVKGKITDVLVDAVKKTHDIVDSFVDSFRNGIFVLLTFVLTVVVVNGLKDTNAAAIFSEAYIWVVGILSGLMTAWVFSARAGSLSQFDKAFDSIEQVLKGNYRGVLEEAEIESALAPVRTSNRKYLLERSKHYVWLWLFIVGVLLLGFVGGNKYFITAPLASDSPDSKVVPQSPESEKVDVSKLSPSETTSTNGESRAAPGNPLDRRVDLRQKDSQ